MLDFSSCFRMQKHSSPFLYCFFPLLLFFPFILLVLIAALRTELIASRLIACRQNHSWTTELLFIGNTFQMNVLRYFQRSSG